MADQEILDALEYWQAEGDIAKVNEIRTQHLGMPPIQEGGMGFGDRSAVGAARGPGARQQTLQNRYPDRQVTPFGKDNFLAGDQLYNQPGFDMGDVAEYGRVGAEAGGALIGGTLGAPGNIPGIMAGAALGGEGAGQLYDKGMEYFAGTEDTRSPEDALVDTATSAAFNSMGGPTPNPRFAAMDDVTRSMIEPIRPSMPISEAENIVGTDMTPGYRGSPMFQKIEAGLESLPASTGTMHTARMKTINDLDKYLDESLPLWGTREQAGDAATAGVAGRVGEKSRLTREYPAESLRGREGKLYDEVENRLVEQGESTLSRVDIDHLTGLSAQFKHLIQRDAEFARLVNSDPLIGKTIAAADAFTARAAKYDELVGEGMAHQEALEAVGGPIKPTYEILKEWRSIIGRKMEDTFLTDINSNQQALKKLYATLTGDMNKAVQELGGDGATHARQRAEQFTTGLSRRLEHIDPIFRSADNPTQVFEALSTALINNPKMVAAAKKTMGEDAWNQFVDTYIHNITRATKGGQNVPADLLSPQTTSSALANLKRKSPEGYRLITEGKEKAIEAAHTIANAMQGAERHLNWSRTAGTAATQNLLTLGGSAGLGAGASMVTGGAGPLALAAGGAALSTVLPWLIAKAVTSPRLASVITKVSSSLGERTLSSADLVRAMSVAGMDRVDLEELKGMLGIESTPPTKDQQNPY